MLGLLNQDLECLECSSRIRNAWITLARIRNGKSSEAGSKYVLVTIAGFETVEFI